MESIDEEKEILTSFVRNENNKENKYHEEFNGNENLCIPNLLFKQKLTSKEREDFDRIILNAMTNTTASSATIKRTIPMFIVLHYSPFKTVWDWLMTILILYTSIVIPYTITFGLHQEIIQMQQNSDSHSRFHVSSSEFRASDILNPLAIADLICDLTFIMDVIIMTRTTFMHNGEVVTDPKEIAKHYLQGHFLLDLLASTPFDLIFHGGNDAPDVWHFVLFSFISIAI